MEYTYQTLIGQVSSLGVAAAISIINKLIEYIAHFFIKRIGFSYVTEELTSLMTTIFYSQFINTGLVLLLANANFEHTPLSFIPLR